MFPGDGDHRRLVHIFVRVHAAQHARHDQKLIAHDVLPFVRVSEWEVAVGQGRQDVDETGSKRSSSYEVMPARPTLWHRAGQTDQTKDRLLARPSVKLRVMPKAAVSSINVKFSV